MVARLPEFVGRRTILLAGGDFTAIGLFVAVGELSHGNPILAGTGTFVAFGLAWSIVAVALGAYRQDAVASPGGALRTGLLAWIPAALLGQLLRLVVEPAARLAPAFVAVSLAIGGSLLGGWRLVAAWVLAAKA